MQIFVLGMHRSGTSMVTRLLMRLGCWFGPESFHLEPKAENPKGFWERTDVRKMNDRFLHAAGADWHLVSAFDLEASDPDEQARYRHQAQDVVAQLNERRPWVLKEPRLCLLFPLWRPLLDRPAAVLTLRHPVEVAHSLLERNGFPLAAGIALWEAYLARSLNSSDGIPRLVVHHDDFFRDPRNAVSQVTRWLEDQNISPAPVHEEELNDLIDPALYRQRMADLPTSGLVNRSQRRLYEALRAGRLDELPRPVPLSEEARRILGVFESFARPRPDGNHLPQEIELLQRQLHRASARATAANVAHEGAEQRLAAKLSESERLRREIARLDASRDRLQSEYQRTKLDADLRRAELHRGFLLQQGCCLRQQIRLKQGWIDELHGHVVAATGALGWRMGRFLFTRLPRSVPLLRRNETRDWTPHEAHRALQDYHAWRSQHQSLDVSSPRLLQSFVNPTVAETISRDLLQSFVGMLEEEEQTLFQLRQVDYSLEQWLLSVLGSLESLYRSQPYHFGKWMVDHGLKRLCGRPPFLAQLPYRTQAVRHRLEGLVQSRAPQHSDPALGLPHQPQTPLVIQYTPATPRNPYYTMFPQALAGRGWKIRYDDQPESVERQIAAANGQGVLIHFHQLEPYYHGGGGDLESARTRARQLANQLKRYKQLGARLVWTIHNPLPHDRRFREIDEELIAAVLPAMDELIVLGRNAKSHFEKKWRHPHVTVVPHPSYQFSYGGRVTKTAARERLQIDQDVFLLGHIGHIKEYKWLETIIQAFTKARGRTTQEIRLLIAGSESPPGYAQSLATGAGEGVIIRPEFIPDEELSCWLGALDASVFAFRDIWASGSVILSLSQGVPVITPRLGCLAEYVSHGNNGYLYRHGDVDDFAQAILAIAQSGELSDHYAYMCDRFNREFAVDRIVPELEALYHRVQ